MKEHQQPLFKKRRGSFHLQTDHHRVRMHQGAEPVGARRRTSRGSFAQKILLAGPELWLQGTDPGLQAVCNLDEKLRGKVVQIPKHIASGVIPNYTVQWYSSGNSRLNVNQLTTEFAPTPTNKRLLLSAIAAYEGERRPRQRRRLSMNSEQISSQRSSQTVNSRLPHLLS